MTTAHTDPRRHRHPPRGRLVSAIDEAREAAAMAALDEARRDVARLTAALTEARTLAGDAVAALDRIGKGRSAFDAEEVANLRARLAALEVTRG